MKLFDIIPSDEIILFSDGAIDTPYERLNKWYFTPENNEIDYEYFKDEYDSCVIEYETSYTNIKVNDILFKDGNGPSLVQNVKLTNMDFNDYNEFLFP